MQAEGTNLCAFYICEYIRMSTTERRTQDFLQVR
jgi:hypothetical protein